MGKIYDTILIFVNVVILEEKMLIRNCLQAAMNVRRADHGMTQPDPRSGPGELKLFINIISPQ